MKKEFAKATFLTQVRRLRKLAILALKEYSIKVDKIKFINHSENTTFKIITKDAKKYLLRIHRNNNHSKLSILEELEWLSEISKTSQLQVPIPVLTKQKSMLVTISTPEVASERHCCLFQWIEARFIRKSMHTNHLYQLGQQMAQLHLSTRGKKVVHRNYWTADGMIGKNAKFGSIENLIGVSPGKQKIITEAKNNILLKIKRFEKKYPERLGLIHADLHFKNILLGSNNSLVTIDFDDCGTGFFLYDIAIPLMSVETILGTTNKKDMKYYKKAFIDGYTTFKKWDAEDEKMLPYFIITRKLVLLGWINMRTDNLKVNQLLNTFVKSTLKEIKSYKINL